MDEPQLRRMAAALIAELIARDVIENAEQATGWLLLCTDEETTRHSCYGPYADPVAAFAASQAFAAELHRGQPVGEPGWSLSILPLLPPLELK